MRTERGPAPPAPAGDLIRQREAVEIDDDGREKFTRLHRLDNRVRQWLRQRLAIGDHALDVTQDRGNRQKAGLSPTFERPGCRCPARHASAPSGTC